MFILFLFLGHYRSCWFRVVLHLQQSRGFTCSSTWQECGTAVRLEYQVKKFANYLFKNFTFSQVDLFFFFYTQVWTHWWCTLVISCATKSSRSTGKSGLWTRTAGFSSRRHGESRCGRLSVTFFIVKRSILRCDVIIVAFILYYYKEKKLYYWIVVFVYRTCSTFIIIKKKKQNLQGSLKNLHVVRVLENRYLYRL